MKRLFLSVFIMLLVLPGAFAIDTLWFAPTLGVLSQDVTFGGISGGNFSLNVTGVTSYIVKTVNVDQRDIYTIYPNGTIYAYARANTSNEALFDVSLEIGLWYFGASNNGSGSTAPWSQVGYGGNPTEAGTWQTNGFFCTDASGQSCSTGISNNLKLFQIQNVTFIVSSVLSPAVVTVQAQNIVNNSLVSGFCADFSQGGVSQFYACNVTGTNIPFNVTGVYNITILNITDGHDVPVYFNATNNNFNLSEASTLAIQTAQALLSVTTTQLYTGIGILVFNATNDQTTNTTTTGTVLVFANNGTNTISIDVPGNYSVSGGCSVAPPFSSAPCSIGGVYDTILTVNATNNTVPIVGFTNTIINTTLSISNTSVGSQINYSLLQGFAYYLAFNYTGLTSTNATVTPSSPTEFYTFVVVPAPSVNFSFLDEITNTLITENISLEIINDAFSQNYTVENGLFMVNLTGRSGLTIFRYKSFSYEQRDYIIQLDIGVNYQVPLYDINISESDVVMTTVTDTSNTPLEGALVSLLRYFVGCNCYNIVQMGLTSGNGQVPFYVQALDGHYKWSVSYQNTTFFLSTTSEQINSDTRVFILNLGTDFYAGYQGLDGLAYLTTFNTSNGALTFTWNDPTSEVVGACLDATVLSGTTFVSVGAICSGGSSGSQFLSLDNTTAYTWTASVNTTSQFTPFVMVDSGSISVQREYDFGNQGLFLALAILIVLVLIFSYSATATVIISVVGVIIINILGLLPFTASFVTAISVLSLGLVLYVMRS